MTEKEKMMAQLLTIFGQVKDVRYIYPAKVQEIMQIMNAASGFHFEEVALEVDCPNGYTASVTRKCGTYGANKGLFEVAVMRDGTIVYDTPVTDDVLGYQTPEDVVRAVAAIAAL